MLVAAGYGTGFDTVDDDAADDGHRRQVRYRRLAGGGHDDKDADDADDKERVYASDLVASLVTFGWVLFLISCLLFLAARSERKNSRHFVEYSNIETCVQYFEDLHSPPPKVRKALDAAEEGFELMKRDTSEIITKANPTSFEKFAMWIRQRQRREQAQSESEELCCGFKSHELLVLSVDAVFLLQCTYLAVVLTEGGEITAGLSEERVVWRVVWIILMVLPGLLITVAMNYTIKEMVVLHIATEVEPEVVGETLDAMAEGLELKSLVRGGGYGRGGGVWTTANYDRRVPRTMSGT